MAWLGSPTTKRSSFSPSRARSSAVLQRVDVLELIYENVAPAPALGGGETAVRLQRVRVPPQQVVEVDQAPAAFLVLIAPVEGGNRFGVRWQLPARRCDCGDEPVRRDQAGLGPFDHAGQLADIDSFEAGPPCDELGNEVCLCVAAKPAQACGGLPTIV